MKPATLLPGVIASCVLACALGWCVAGQPNADKPRTVRDEAGLFSKEAKEKADAEIARFKSEFKKDLIIETLGTLAIPDGKSKDEATDAWAAKRIDPGADAIFIGIIVDPRKYRIRFGKPASKLFTENNVRELEKILIGHLKAKEMDQALTDCAAYVVEAVRRNGLLAAGMQIIEVKSGSGPSAKRGDTLTLQYTGRFKDGKTFDKTSEPITLTLKEGILIKGFEQGIVGMKAGGVRKLIVPPELGYGKEGVGNIPPAAELHFEIELLKIR